MSDKISEWEKFFIKLAHTAALAIAGYVMKKFPEWFSSVKNWWTGKTIAIIGPTASGKNSMFNQLRHQPVPEEHIQTRGAEKVKDFDFKWTLPGSDEFVEFKCRRALNIGGEADERDRYWLQACEEADVIFYLFDSARFKTDEKATLQRFRDDMQWLRANLRHCKRTVSVHLLANKIDIAFGPDLRAASADKAMKDLVRLIEELTEETLGSEFKGSRVTGVTPICTRHETLFGEYFAGALSLIAQLKQQ
ncbi:GTPase domain-containing protein [Paraburkholderia sp. J67]|uniref:GTPase domain-containing protein n=1 Tax=Paraburkholderia sp. J67 TaxID=2805435 RepID=UPI002ABDAC37|nr:GTPase domain-containing protein [Paraburkholderia sp. J67]